MQQPKPGNPQEPRQSYACWLAVDHGRVYLTETSGTDGIWTPLASSGAVTIFLNTPYRVLLTVQGNQIRCSVPTLSVQLSANDSTITSAGNAGLFTVYAHASWEYLKVTGP